MTAERLSYAVAHGLALPSDGRIAWIGAPGDSDIGPLDPARLEIVQGFAPDAAAWQVRGLTVVPAPAGPYAAVIVTLPRARDRAEAWLAQAEAAAPGGLIVLDGAKTDGAEALAKALKGRVAIEGQVSKAHGKCLWFRSGDAMADWARPAMAPNADGDSVAPGVFSADGPDPASVALAEALPPLKGVVADLGAGWGWLARAVLARSPGIDRLHLVEADMPALDCARANVTDPRARFHWDDATAWKAPEALDAVVMNPPFHVGRKGDPRLGQAFIAAAARMLATRGQLWMVANRHLPYETALAQHFGEVAEVAGTSKFKILHAARPIRAGRHTGTRTG
ncbi:class I SAM-dependent methyltransferase [Thetidibacter halocola]|uniref:Class I SAM-dependent methyltransferase n=1 Tax=Thetidibacter halocola TaxID=2827239 RepID=A0A8J8B9I4_9RHOB|nr:methyltransferase [Thetidibacter halocola]MBS0125580.1 class I SAM-dependent methyltransferase [Thetidibacter halocola]